MALVQVTAMPNSMPFAYLPARFITDWSSRVLTRSTQSGTSYSSAQDGANYTAWKAFADNIVNTPNIVDILQLPLGAQVFFLRNGGGYRLRITARNETASSIQFSWDLYATNIHDLSLTYISGNTRTITKYTGAGDYYHVYLAAFVDDDNSNFSIGIVDVFNYYRSASIQYWCGIQYNTWSASLTANNLYVNFFGGAIEPAPTPSTDPYADGGYSTGTSSGTGTFDDTSESVPLPTTYALSATASGLMSQYVLTEANLAAFGSWLWNGGTIVDDLKHFFQSPMEAIFSVGILPFTPSDTTPYNVYVGALAVTGVQGGLVGDTVEKISCGSIDFDGYYGGALDYNPYTKIELFLPYCGTLSLNADEVMGHTISVDYYCDSISGDCVAFVSDEERVLHQVRGNCFIQIPLAARDFTALYSSAIAAIGTIAAGLATAASGGLSAPVAVGMGSSMAANAMNAKTHIARAGGVSGMAGFMSIQTPYVIMTIPNQCLPEFQNDFQGYPLFVTKRLGDFSGFTKVYEIHLDGLDCTDAEAKEIYELLKGGVIL